MATKTKPKLIPLKELRALCKEAGVSFVRRFASDIWWDIHREDTGHVTEAALTSKEYKHECRQNLAAFCYGLIAMRKRGEL